MSDATLLQEETKEERGVVAPVECKHGHINDPYPENGLCVECGIWLPGNKYRLHGEEAKNAPTRGKIRRRSQEQIAKNVLEDEGVPWKEATEGLRQLALMFAKSKNVKTLELILQQIGVLKAKPKPGEEATELKYEVSLTSGSVEDLKRSLSDLDDALRID